MLSRRQFLSLIASGVAAEALLPYCEPALRAELLLDAQDTQVYLKKRYVTPNKAYGSGAFGEWISDSEGLPCYHYTCNQTEDPAAVTPVETAWRAPTDQTHQIGNDRIVATASNYGYLQVRQDEGGARFLNDFKPAEGFFGGGLGYLTDGDELLGTYFPGSGTSFERFFGMGYLRKQTAGKNFSIDQVIFAPFGDDPVLMSEVVVSSQSPKTVNLIWAEYWGCQHYPFSYHAYIDGETGGHPDPEKIVALRRQEARRLGHHFEKITGGMIESKQFPTTKGGGLRTAEAIQEEAAGPNFSSTLPPSGDHSISSMTADESLPPQTFLASLDDGPFQLLSNATAFFGGGNVMGHIGAAGPTGALLPQGVLQPAGLAKLVPANAGTANAPADDLSATGTESALILVKPFTLDSGQSQTLRFIYGYLPRGFSAAQLIAKYRANAPVVFAQSCAAWKDEGAQLSVDSDPWVEREIRWHNYYLRSGFTFDDFFEEHIVSQGQTYQYCIGFQGAARDPLQHALPLVFGESRLAKEVLRYTLKSQQPDGSLPFALTRLGLPVSFPWQASDLDLWLLWLASEYVLATRDSVFLEERLSVYPLTPSGPTLAVREMLARSYHHLVETVGTGKHGLLRGVNDDWNDNIYQQGVTRDLASEVERESESVMNAAMAAYILDRYAAMLRYCGDLALARDAEARAGSQRRAVSAQWAGRWFKRLWLGPTGGWLGEDRMWLEGQPWAILGGCATGNQQKTLARAMDELLRKPSMIGAKQVSKPVDWPGFVPGELGNGGVWAALDGPLIWALAGIDPAMAWDEWQKNSRAHHAETYPDVWYGIWSGPDVYCSSDSEHAGQTAYDWGLIDAEAHRRPSILRGISNTAWPVMNMHRHAWPLYSAAKLMGIEFTEAGVDLAPSIPKPEYSFRSRLLGLAKSKSSYDGWYAPQNAGTWKIRVKLAAEESPFKKLTINGAAQPVPLLADGVLEFSGSSSLGQPLRWSLEKG